MRIADKMQFNQINQNVNKNRAEMSELQNQAATQKRLTKPSDDPMGSTSVLSARTEERGNKQFIKSINAARSFLEYTDQSLGELSEILVRAKELAISQSNDASANEETRRTVAAEVNQIYNQSVQIGNRRLGERYIFGGFNTQKMPFNNAGSYLGDDGAMKLPIGKDAFIAINIPGSTVFLGEGFTQDGFTGPSLETPTSATDLQDLKHFEEERKEKNLENKENLVETRSLASVATTKSRGKNEESSNAETVGVNIFNVIKNLDISLRTNDKVGVQETLDQIDKAISQVILARSEIGSRVTAANNLSESLQKSIVDNKTVASQIEDADAFQVISDINKTDSALKATLETSGKLIQKSLMDFLR